MNYKLSIIIPTYNAENYLLEAVNSIKNQSLGFEKVSEMYLEDGIEHFEFLYEI